MRGALLIGGQSSRMGVPKCLLEREGRPLALVLGDLLQRVTGSSPFVLGSQPRLRVPDDWPVINDRSSGEGPLSALLGLFDGVPNETFIVLACDLFAMREPAIRWLKQQAGTSNRDVIWPRFPDRNHGEPLAAVYRPTIIEELEKAWAVGKRSLIGSVAPGFREQPVIPDEYRHYFRNVNTPDQLADLRAQAAKDQAI